MPENSNTFIPANESRWFIFIFDIYVRNLFRRRFQNVLIDQHYQPGKKAKTIYYLNHTSWWDGLIPLLLNQKRFKQHARAMMQDKQMTKHKFFSKIGAFSVNPDHPRSAAASLRYAEDSMKRPNSSLFIYPEGKIVPFAVKKPEFRKGLGWISNQCPDADVVPVGICIHTARYSKPELFIRVGKPVSTDHSLDSETLNEIFEIEMENLLKKLQTDAYHFPERFQQL